MLFLWPRRGSGVDTGPRPCAGQRTPSRLVPLMRRREPAGRHARTVSAVP